MQRCGASGCGSTADLKCARCQGVFYCDASCQKADWRRHKQLCKPLTSSSAASSELEHPRQLRRGRLSSSQVDIELLRLVGLFLESACSSPKRAKKELPSVLQRASSLLARGARPDVRVSMTFGGPALLHSCVSAICAGGRPGVEPLLELLLAADCKPALDINAASVEPGTETLVTPVYGAACMYRPTFLRLLVAHGADLRAPCAQRKDGRLEWPVKTVVSCIVDDPEADGAVDDACETLDYLVAAGADVDAADGRWLGDQPPDDTPLLHALSCCDLPPARRAIVDAVARRLIEAGANVHTRDYLQVRPLDFAAELPSLDIFKALVAKGADPSPTSFIAHVAPGQEDEWDQFGAHYLERATEDGRADVLEAAAAAGVDINKLTTLGRVAMPLLAFATIRGQLACVRFLLDYGVDVNSVYKDGDKKFTACDVAHLGLPWGGFGGAGVEIMAALRAAGAKLYSEL